MKIIILDAQAPPFKVLHQLARWITSTWPMVEVEERRRDDLGSQSFEGVDILVVGHADARKGLWGRETCWHAKAAGVFVVACDCSAAGTTDRVVDVDNLIILKQAVGHEILRRLGVYAK